MFSFLNKSFLCHPDPPHSPSYPLIVHARPHACSHSALLQWTEALVSSAHSLHG